MRKLIAIGGLPAAGKTTIMKKFLEGKYLEKKEPEKLVTAMYDGQYDLYIVGDYSDPEEKFPGLDRLSMAVQPEAIKFLKKTKSNILFEGDRLFTASFLEEAANLVDAGELELKIVIINADPLLVEQRHKDRADTQTEKFLKGRATKYENIQSSFLLMSYIEVMNNNTEEDLRAIVNWLRLELHESDEIVEIL
jgi:GTPase SAR1 family protein